MKAIKQAAALSATALLLTHAQAAPKPAIPPAPVDKIHTVCKTTVKDSNGKLVGQRSTSDDSRGIVARVRTITTRAAASAGTIA